MSTLRLRLRDATREDHDRVDHGMSLGSPDVDRAGIETALTVLWGFHRSLEPLLTAHNPWGPTLPRSTWLAADLARLGRTATDAPDTPLLVGDEQLGAHYVVEGSGLGARVITKNLAQVAPWLPAPHTFSRVSEQTADRWPRFLAALEQCRDPDAAERGARTTFALLAGLL